MFTAPCSADPWREMQFFCFLNRYIMETLKSVKRQEILNNNKRMLEGSINVNSEVFPKHTWKGRLQISYLNWILTQRSAFKNTKVDFYKQTNTHNPITNYKNVFLQKIKTWKGKDSSQSLSILKFMEKSKQLRFSFQIWKHKVVISHPIEFFTIAEWFRQALLTHYGGRRIYHLNNTFCTWAENYIYIYEKYWKIQSLSNSMQL